MKQTKIKKIIVFLSIILVIPFLLNLSTSYAKSNISASYEVKLLLNTSKVLKNNGELEKKYREEFDIPKSYSERKLYYIETPHRDFSNAGWTNRIRINKGDHKYKLTYKKRYPIYNGDLKTALNLANDEGFDESDTNYIAEIDWGYDKMTLSISNNKYISAKHYGDYTLPPKDKVLEIMKDKMPGKEKNWLYPNWGYNNISYSQAIGPIEYKKYKGKYKGKSIYIEIWYLDNTNESNITEISFKDKYYKNTKKLREELINKLDDLNILEHRDALKTDTIISSYFGD